jgi:hypothetical protein
MKNTLQICILFSWPQFRREHKALQKIAKKRNEVK